MFLTSGVTPAGEGRRACVHLLFSSALCVKVWRSSFTAMVGRTISPFTVLGLLAVKDKEEVLGATQYVKKY